MIGQTRGKHDNCELHLSSSVHVQKFVTTEENVVCKLEGSIIPCSLINFLNLKK